MNRTRGLYGRDASMLMIVLTPTSKRLICAGKHGAAMRALASNLIATAVNTKLQTVPRKHRIDRILDQTREYVQRKTRM